MMTLCESSNLLIKVTLQLYLCLFLFLRYMKLIAFSCPQDSLWFQPIGDTGRYSKYKGGRCVIHLGVNSVLQGRLQPNPTQGSLSINSLLKFLINASSSCFLRLSEPDTVPFFKIHFLSGVLLLKTSLKIVVCHFFLLGT